MKGSIKFTKSEANQIRKLINQKLEASTNAQKSIRNKIRNLNFYYSDFSSKKGYTVQDFDILIKKGQISIIGEVTIENNQTTQLPTNIIQTSIIKQLNNKKVNIEKELIINGNFSSIKDLNQKIIGTTGFYCIKLKSNSILPDKYQKILDKRTHKIIYIGKAEGQTLRKRLEQELELKSPVTFFRSIGCVLDFHPIKGHLQGKSNQNNFKFSKINKEEIIKWLNDNVEISIATFKGDFSIESKLIEKYSPLLNDTHNLMKLQELKVDKDKCRKIARN